MMDDTPGLINLSDTYSANFFPLTKLSTYKVSTPKAGVRQGYGKCKLAILQMAEQSGAAEKCCAYNPEVDRSKPSSGNYGLFYSTYLTVNVLQ